jgi:hypothetical protein
MRNLAILFIHLIATVAKLIGQAVPALLLPNRFSLSTN